MIKTHTFWPMTSEVMQIHSIRTLKIILTQEWWKEVWIKQILPQRYHMSPFLKVPEQFPLFCHHLWWCWVASLHSSGCLEVLAPATRVQGLQGTQNLAQGCSYHRPTSTMPTSQQQPLTPQEFWVFSALTTDTELRVETWAQGLTVCTEPCPLFTLLAWRLIWWFLFCSSHYEIQKVQKVSHYFLQ